MTRDEIVALFARRQQALDRHDAAALAADYAEDSLVYSPMAGGAVQGYDAIAKIYTSYFTALADMTFTQEELLIDGDRVMQLGRITGTDTGGFMGLAPSQRAISFSVVLLYELRDGRITRERRVYDFTGVLLQIGVIKAKPA
jgi:steroid delta-isomerase-like uncharacterized protein